jgi:hypothetical protein
LPDPEGASRDGHARGLFLFGAAPRPAGDLDQPAPTARIKDESLLQTSIAFEIVQDFVTVVMNAFMPEADPWCERRAGACPGRCIRAGRKTGPARPT